jgi:hypothetical protein
MNSTLNSRFRSAQILAAKAVYLVSFDEINVLIIWLDRDGFSRELGIKEW